ncbi:hypothetical protein GCM10025879_03990 [Leuconostoc litchii]|nr:alpha/beta fold hydrolase [Leuconostoc litchii]GMA69153.1 hypothetical protein GCM10025879_03990 [Leuconostoc litchii]
MRIDTKEYCYNVQVTVNNKDNVKWLLLHGFMGSHHDFDQIIRRLPGQVLTIDLLGFGDKMPTVAPEQFRMSNQIDDLVHILKQLDWHDIKLLGYSMGGRLALGFAISHPYLVHQLYLESATAGLKTPQERDVRCQADFQKAEQIEDNFADFVASWEKMPLFSTQQNVTVAQKNLCMNNELIKIQLMLPIHCVIWGRVFKKTIGQI